MFSVAVVRYCSEGFRSRLFCFSFNLQKAKHFKILGSHGLTLLSRSTAVKLQRQGNGVFITTQLQKL